MDIVKGDIGGKGENFIDLMVVGGDYRIYIGNDTLITLDGKVIGLADLKFGDYVVYYKQTNVLRVSRS
jgi:hypothetical protein